MPDDAISLREHFEAEIATLRLLIDERDRLYTAQFKASEVAVAAALLAQKESVSNAFLASEKAIVKAEDAQKDYNIRSNEFRGQLDDQAKTLMPRLETLSLFKSVDDKINNLQKNFEDKLEAQRLSNEKLFDAGAKEIAGLRESRSEGAGKGSQEAVTALASRTQWFLVVSVTSAIIAFATLVFRFMQ